MTAPLDLAAIRARAEAASEGPWEAEALAGNIVTPTQGTIAEVCSWIGADAAFIAHAREDIPALLAEVERLRALVPECACGPWHPDMDGPNEECPQHGRSYREWIDRGDRLAATVDRVQVIVDDWAAGRARTAAAELRAVIGRDRLMTADDLHTRAKDAAEERYAAMDFLGRVRDPYAEGYEAGFLAHATQQTSLNRAIQEKGLVLARYVECDDFHEDGLFCEEGTHLVSIHKSIEQVQAEMADEESGTPRCPFCERRDNSDFEQLYAGVVMRFAPLNPVTDGHMLFMPAEHMEHPYPDALATTMRYVGKYAAERNEDYNIITSSGPAATQTVKHLHVHYVPRREGDGLHLPWTGQRKH